MFSFFVVIPEDVICRKRFVISLSTNNSIFYRRKMGMMMIARWSTFSGSKQSWRGSGFLNKTERNDGQTLLAPAANDHSSDVVVSSFFSFFSFWFLFYIISRVSLFENWEDTRLIGLQLWKQTSSWSLSRMFILRLDDPNFFSSTLHN